MADDENKRLTASDDLSTTIESHVRAHREATNRRQRARDELELERMADTQKPSLTTFVMHDWHNQTPAERAQAIADVRELAEKTMVRGEHRRGRALNIMASFFALLEEA